jgi:glycosyltransferase involved in cell wall biosynthesis
VARAFCVRSIETQARNLAAVRNAGAQCANGDIIITIDADSVMSPNMLVEIERQLSSGEVIGGGTMIWPDRMSFGLMCTGVLLVLLIGRHRISAGLFWLYRRDFVALGGFDESLVSAEDVDFAIRLRDYGKARAKRFVTLTRAFITTSCRKFNHFGDWYFLRNVKLLRAILSGKDRSAADLVYYDFPH